jgi:hypothetical protein
MLDLFSSHEKKKFSLILSDLVRCINARINSKGAGYMLKLLGQSKSTLMTILR